MPYVDIEELRQRAEQARQGLLQALGARRLELALTQEELAQRTGVARMTVQRAEDGAASLRTVLELSEALGLRVQMASGGSTDAAEPSNPSAPLIHRGLHHERTRRNRKWRDCQREAALASAWEALNDERHLGTSPLLAALVPNPNQDHATAAASVVQWLGSDVGFNFLQGVLEKVGYRLVDLQEKPART